MTYDIYRPSTLDGLESEEEKLYRELSEHRAEQGLAPIPLSRSLTLVANRHVLDLEYNLDSLTHGWSDAPYDPTDPSTYGSTWEAPARLGTEYPGYGYEIAHGSYGSDTSAERAIESWNESPGHRAVMLNENNWSDNQWQSVGIGIYEGFAVMWFGEETDPSGAPSQESDQQITGDEERNILRGTSNNDIITGQGEVDKIQGRRGDDILGGGAKRDRLSGGSGNDILFGESGRDRLIGGRGNDQLYGGRGADRFILRGHSGIDEIQDFNPRRDRLQLSGQIDRQDITLTRSGRDTVIENNDIPIARLQGIHPSQINDQNLI